jgi:hypothetical protein
MTQSLHIPWFSPAGSQNNAKWQGSVRGTTSLLRLYCHTAVCQPLSFQPSVSVLMSAGAPLPASPHSFSTSAASQTYHSRLQEMC